MRRGVVGLLVALLAACGGEAGGTTTLPASTTVTATTTTTATSTSTSTTSTTMTVAETTTTTTFTITEASGDIWFQNAPLYSLGDIPQLFPSQHWFLGRALSITHATVDDWQGRTVEIETLSVVLGACRDGSPFVRDFLVRVLDPESPLENGPDLVRLRSRSFYPPSLPILKALTPTDPSFVFWLERAVVEHQEIGLTASAGDQWGVCPNNLPRPICDWVQELRERYSVSEETTETLVAASDSGIDCAELSPSNWIPTAEIYLFPPVGGWPVDELAVPYALVGRTVASPPPTPIPGTLTGTLTLTASVPDIRIGSQNACQGVRDAADIVPGLEVVARDPGSGRVLARGLLEGGRVTAETATTRDCQFPFTISGLGTGWETVEVTVGDGSRGAVTYSLDEVVAAGWAVALGVEQP